jgi:uncharacterized protein
MGVSSLHITFNTEEEWLALGEAGYLQRCGIQYHWENQVESVCLSGPS